MSEDRPLHDRLMEALENGSARASVLIAEQIERMGPLRRHMVTALPLAEEHPGLDRAARGVVASLDQYLQSLWAVLPQVQADRVTSAEIARIRTSHQAMVDGQMHLRRLEEERLNELQASPRVQPAMERAARDAGLDWVLEGLEEVEAE